MMSDNEPYREATQHYDTIYNFILGRVDRDAEAEDLTQQVFETAIRSWDEYEEGTDCLAWLFSIARNRICRHHDKENLERPESFQDRNRPIEEGESHFSSEQIYSEDEQPHSLEGFANEYGADPVLEAVEELPEYQKAPVMLYMVQGYQYKEIAERLQVPIGTIMSRIHRARQTLQDELESYAEREGYV